MVEQVLEYTVSNLQELSSNTYAFRDAMFNSTLPWQLVDSAAGRVSVIRSPSTMWLGDGNFYCFEGCNGCNSHGFVSLYGWIRLQCSDRMLPTELHSCIEL